MQPACSVLWMIVGLVAPTTLLAHETPSAAVAEQCASLADATRLRGMFDVVFSRDIQTEGRTRSFAYQRAGHAFKTFEEINDYNVESTALDDATATRLVLEDVPMESSHWRSVRTAPGAATLIRDVAAALTDIRDDNPKLASPTVLQKALLQRDLFQTFSIMDLASSRVADVTLEQTADGIQACLAAMIDASLLSIAEYEELTALLPRNIPKGYVTSAPRSLAERYLPPPVVRRHTPSWLEIPAGVTPFRHFTHYGGRSFVKVYMHAPRQSPDQLRALWQELYAAHGNRLHMTAIKQRAPHGLQTMLVRSFGVFLADGSYRDSYWPEEVIIRILRRPQETIDLTSSDFRGTLFFQYRMSRALVLKSPQSLGLKRVMDDDEQFFGFYGDVPDPMAYANTTSTMRTNCIGCHSELFYGLNTVFSFERNPTTQSPINNLLRPRGPGSYELLTPEAERLRERWASERHSSASADTLEPRE